MKEWVNTAFKLKLGVTSNYWMCCSLLYEVWNRLAECKTELLPDVS